MLLRVSSTSQMCFHAYKSVAPLKRCGLEFKNGLAYTGFHAYKSVAPLKQRDQHSVSGFRIEFPRLQKRGPIEAQGSGSGSWA